MVYSKMEYYSIINKLQVHKLGDRYMDVFIFINYSLSHTCIECTVSFTINNFWLQH